MSFKNVRDAVDAENNGQTFFSAWRKTPTQVTGAGIWFDLSMSPGNPVPNYYAATPNIALALKQSLDGGIPHGSNVGQLGMTKYLKTFMAMTTTAAAVPLPMILCDYLLYYPFVDMSITDTQYFDNTVTLPRDKSGAGVQIMAVEVAGQNGVGNPKFQVGYTNSKGISGRMTPLVACNTQVVNGTIINSQTTDVVGARAATGPFLALQPGDTGVQKIDSIQFQSPDIGLIALVLVSVIGNIAIRTIDAPMERTPFVDMADLPVIADDAYLGLICMPNGNLAGAPIHGTIQTIWG
jgi:hypothetical protein